MAKRKQPNGVGERPRYNKARRRWEARYTLGFDAAGRPIRKMVTGHSEAEVRSRLGETIRVVDAGAPFDAALTFGKYAGWWADNVLPGEGRAQATEAFYVFVLDKWVLPRIGRVRLSGRNALRPDHIEEMVASMRTEGLSPRSQQGSSSDGSCEGAPPRATGSSRRTLPASQRHRGTEAPSGRSRRCVLRPARSAPRRARGHAVGIRSPCYRHRPGCGPARHAASAGPISTGK